MEKMSVIKFLILDKPPWISDIGSDDGHFSSDDGRFFRDDGYFFFHVGQIFFHIEHQCENDEQIVENVGQSHGMMNDFEHSGRNVGSTAGKVKTNVGRFTGNMGHPNLLLNVLQKMLDIFPWILDRTHRMGKGMLDIPVRRIGMGHSFAMLNHKAVFIGR